MIFDLVQRQADITPVRDGLIFGEDFVDLAALAAAEQAAHRPEAGSGPIRRVA